jgi:hypothetical protein
MAADEARARVRREREEAGVESKNGGGESKDGGESESEETAIRELRGALDAATVTRTLRAGRERDATVEEAEARRRRRALDERIVIEK